MYTGVVFRDVYIVMDVRCGCLDGCVYAGVVWRDAGPVGFVTKETLVNFRGFLI